MGWACAVERQIAAYPESVLPLALPTEAAEAAHPDFWRKYVGRNGAVVGMPTFGESAPAKDLHGYFSITVQKIVDATVALLQHHDVVSRDEERV